MKNTTIVRNMIEDQKTICQTIKKDLRLNQLSSLKDTDPFNPYVLNCLVEKYFGCCTPFSHAFSI